MSTIKSQHRKACGHLTIIHRDDLPPIKIWRYSMSLKAFARDGAAVGHAPAIRWLDNKGVRLPHLDETERKYRFDRAMRSHGT